MKAAAEARGLTTSAYVRDAALARADVSAEDRTALLYQLARLGNNLNQLAKAAHQGKLRESHPGEWTQLLDALADTMRALR